MEAILVLIAIVLTVYVGNRYDVNIGLLGLAFAYLLGTLVIGMSVNDVLSTFPIRLFMVIFGVSMFFNFAVVNGTLEKLAKLLLYFARNLTLFLPLLIYLISALVSGLGAGFFTTVAVMTTISMAISDEAGMNKLIAAISISLGSLSGANFPVSSQGVIFSSLLNETVLVTLAEPITQKIFIVTFIYPIIVILFLILLDFRRQKIKTTIGEFKKPEDFTPKQRLNLIYITIFMSILIFIPILSNLFPTVSWLALINGSVDVSLLAIVFAVLGYLTKLAEDTKEVTAIVPWNTIWMVTGMSMLISVAAEAGTIDLLASIVSRMPNVIIPIAIAIISGIMSLFSSTLGVVAPLMFPMVAGIAASTVHSPELLIVAVIVGSQSTAISPFSSGGSLALGNSMLIGEDQQKFFNDLLFKAAPFGMVCATITVTILMFLF